MLTILAAAEAQSMTAKAKAVTAEPEAEVMLAAFLHATRCHLPQATRFLAKQCGTTASHLLRRECRDPGWIFRIIVLEEATDQ